MKRIRLEDYEKKYHTYSYQKLYEKIMSFIEAGEIKPIKASGLNGKKPALFNEYRLVEKKEDYSSYIEELSYEYVPMISTDFYLKHPGIYKEDRRWLLLLNNYLKRNREELRVCQSLNERSFAIWKREKFLKEEEGRRILKRCNISMEQLNIYETTEPLAYYTFYKTVPQNILILENKDTFYSMRRHLINGGNTIFDMSVGTLIYGAGKGILRSFEELELYGEPYMADRSNKIYYFGDLDYEGIVIYESLADKYKNSRDIIPMKHAYLQMVTKAEIMGINDMPDMKEGQKQTDGGHFFSYFEEGWKEDVKKFLEKGKYIPQEIVTWKDL